MEDYCRLDAVIIDMGVSSDLHKSCRSMQMNGCRTTKRMQRDAEAVSIVHSGRRVGNFAERQQLTEGAPLMHMPICGRRAAR